MVSFAICFAVCFAFSTEILHFLERPLAAATNHLIYTALPEIFFTQIKVAMFGGLCLGFPVIAAQVWMFVAPGPLPPREARLPALPDVDPGAVRDGSGVRLLS